MTVPFIHLQCSVVIQLFIFSLQLFPPHRRPMVAKVRSSSSTSLRSSSSTSKLGSLFLCYVREYITINTFTILYNLFYDECKIYPNINLYKLLSDKGMNKHHNLSMAVIRLLQFWQTPPYPNEIVFQRGRKVNIS